VKLIDKIRDLLITRAQAYRGLFLGPYSDIVLKDLAHFCRAHRSTFAPDARAHAVAEGRREVFLRIQKHLKLSDDQLWDLFQGDK